MLTAFQPYVEVFGALVQSGTPSHRRIGICAFDEVLENLEGMHSLCVFILSAQLRLPPRFLWQLRDHQQCARLPACGAFVRCGMSAHALDARDNSVSLHTRLNADMSAPYMPQLLPPLLQYSKDQSAQVRQASVYGVGICAQYGGAVFAAQCAEVCPRGARIAATHCDARVASVVLWTVLDSCHLAIWAPFLVFGLVSALRTDSGWHLGPERSR